MSKYSITAEVLTQLEYEVEADTEDEAREKADRVEINNWTSVQDLNFEVTDIREIENED